MSKNAALRHILFQAGAQRISKETVALAISVDARQQRRLQVFAEAVPQLFESTESLPFPQLSGL